MGFKTALYGATRVRELTTPFSFDALSFGLCPFA